MQHKRVQRSKEERKGMLVAGCAEPQMITLTGRPANQRGFGIQRSEGEEPTARVTRTRRSDSTGLAKIDFPEGYDVDKATEKLKELGLAGYEFEEAEGRVSAMRADLKSTANLPACDSVKLTSDGIVAHVQRSDATTPVAGKTQIAVSAIAFSSDNFSRSDAEAWLEKNGIDFSEKALDNSTGNFVLQRKDVAEGEELRQIELEPGVVANVVRSDLQDIPDGFVVVISEAAYSGWGWGQLDFGAYLTDSLVGDLLRDGVCALEEVLRQIMFYSALPVDMRKELTLRALDQFGAYASNLFDQLPRQLLISVANVERKDKQEEPVQMGKENQEAKSENVTRADMEAMEQRLDGKLNDFLEKLTNAKRNDETAEGAATEQTNAPADATKETTEQKPAESAPADAPNEPAAGGEGGEESKPKEGNVTRSDLEEIVANAVKPLNDKIAELSSTTILRSDNGDAEFQKKAEVKRSDLFAGVLNLQQ